jgi:hypothetical protein
MTRREDTGDVAEGIPTGYISLDLDDPDPLVRCPPSDPKAAAEYHALKNKKPVSDKQAKWIRMRIAELEELLPASEAIAPRSQARTARGPRPALSPPMLPLFAGGGP